VAIKKVEGGIFSTYANENLAKGDVLETMPPMGNFTTEISASNDNDYVAFAAGSGITPVMSIIKTVLQEEPKSSFTLVYGNKEFQSIIFREEIEALKNKYLQRLQVVHVLSRERLESEINYGRIDGEKCDALCKMLLSIEKTDKAFICGPEAMIHSVKDYLLEHGMDKSTVKFELFTSSAPVGKKVEVQSESADDGDLSEVTIKVDDRTFDLKLGSEGFTILDAALSKGADLPYACKGGVCCTCKCKVIEGEVSMDVNYALEDEEVADGYVLSCQAHPTSKKVVIDFDVS
jgi:ring-1,2-phenylacetyl-CoA epoxidase subunit PaaE